MGLWPGGRCVRAGGQGWQVALSSADALLAEVEYKAKFDFSDGRLFKGTFRGLCPQRGTLADRDGRRWRVAYSGDAWLAADMQPVTSEVPGQPGPF